ncbi:MAG: class I SAM-dependent methyltransferase [Candidatus Sulfotelmatobacter sp.]
MIETFRPILNLPWAYQMWGGIVGANEYRKTLAKEHIRARQSDRILDVGCGPGSMVPYLPKSEYVGFDANPDYIQQAQRRFPEAHFTCDQVNEYNLPQSEYFDIVIALGILHHLEDFEAVQLFRMARRTLKPDGRLITSDGVWLASQSKFAKFLLSRDRGRFVRQAEEYVALASTSFSSVSSAVRHDMLRIPYSHLILECRG